jgi:hypothetical protein
MNIFCCHPVEASARVAGGKPVWQWSGKWHRRRADGCARLAAENGCTSVELQMSPNVEGILSGRHSHPANRI